MVLGWVRRFTSGLASFAHPYRKNFQTQLHCLKAVEPEWDLGKGPALTPSRKLCSGWYFKVVGMAKMTLGKSQRPFSPISSSSQTQETCWGGSCVSDSEPGPLAMNRCAQL